MRTDPPCTISPKAKEGGVLIVTPIKIAYEEKTGRKVAESTIYRMLARHNWRKLAPDTGHPKGDPVLQFLRVRRLGLTDVLRSCLVTRFAGSCRGVAP